MQYHSGYALHLLARVASLLAGGGGQCRREKGRARDLITAFRL